MPILSMFYGIVVRMYFFDNNQHWKPSKAMHPAGNKPRAGDGWRYAPG